VIKTPSRRNSRRPTSSRQFSNRYSNSRPSGRRRATSLHAGEFNARWPNEKSTRSKREFNAASKQRRPPPGNVGLAAFPTPGAGQVREAPLVIQAQSHRLRRICRYLMFSSILAVAVTFYAAAQPPAGADPNSEMANWFKSLKSNEGQPCCDVSDCRRVEARLVNGSYEAFIDDEWARVPDAVIKRVENPTGQYIACYTAGDYSTKFPPYFFCFVPISLTDFWDHARRWYAES